MAAPRSRYRLLCGGSPTSVTCTLDLSEPAPATPIEYVMCPTCDERACSCAQHPAPSVKILTRDSCKQTKEALGKPADKEHRDFCGEYSRNPQRFQIPGADTYCTDSRGLSGASSSSTSSSQVDRSPYPYKLPPLEILDEPPRKTRPPLMILVKKKTRPLAPKSGSILPLSQQGTTPGEREPNKGFGSSAKRKIASSVEMMYGKKPKA